MSPFIGFWVEKGERTGSCVMARYSKRVRMLQIRAYVISKTTSIARLRWLAKCHAKCAIWHDLNFTQANNVKCHFNRQHFLNFYCVRIPPVTMKIELEKRQSSLTVLHLTKSHKSYQHTAEKVKTIIQLVPYEK